MSSKTTILLAFATLLLLGIIVCGGGIALLMQDDPTYVRPKPSWTLAFHIAADRSKDASVVALAEASDDDAVVSEEEHVARWIPVDDRSAAEIEGDDTTVTRRLDSGALQVLALIGTSDVDQGDLSSVHAMQDEAGRPCLGATLNEDGGKRMLRLTQLNQGRRMAIVVDGRVTAAPELKATIGRTLLISGEFTQEEVDRLVRGFWQ